MVFYRGCTDYVSIYRKLSIYSNIRGIVLAKKPCYTGYMQNYIKEPGNDKRILS